MQVPKAIRFHMRCGRLQRGRTLIDGRYHRLTIRLQHPVECLSKGLRGQRRIRPGIRRFHRRSLLHFYSTLKKPLSVLIGGGHHFQDRSIECLQGAPSLTHFFRRQDDGVRPQFFLDVTHGILHGERVKCLDLHGLPYDGCANSKSIRTVSNDCRRTKESTSLSPITGTACSIRSLCRRRWRRTTCEQSTIGCCPRAATRSAACLSPVNSLCERVGSRFNMAPGGNAAACSANDRSSRGSKVMTCKLPSGA